MELLGGADTLKEVLCKARYMFHGHYGHYDIGLVMVSVAIAVITAYATLDLAGRVTANQDQTRRYWLLSGAIAMGVGIWAMHFMAMLALHLPFAVAYHWPTVLLSVLPAIVGAGLALNVVSRPEFSWGALLGGSVLLGAGISAMHYTGMAAMRIPGYLRYDGWVVALSVAIAVVVAAVAIGVGFKLRAVHTRRGEWAKLGSALIMGAAIPGMHYTGMAGTHFVHLDQIAVAPINTALLAACTGFVAVLLLGWVLLSSFFEQRLKVQLVRTQVLQDNQQQLENALQRQAELTAANQVKATELKRTLEQLRSAQSQLIHAEKMTALGQMVGGVAHEINNPANFIHGNLSYVHTAVQDLIALVKLYQQQLPQPPADIAVQLEDLDLPFLEADLDKLMASMQTGTQRIKAVVTALRTFSRLDEADRKSTDLNEGLDATLEILKSRLESVPVAVTKHYGDLPPVECYPKQLNQVFFHLVSNAVDALEHGDAAAPMLAISTSVAQGWVSVAIANNGPSIPAKVQRKMYDPFFTTRPVGYGTGLGLSVSHKIVQTHGGRLSCRSLPGEDTVFTVELPVDMVAAETQLAVESV